MTKKAKTVQKAAFVVARKTTGPGDTETVQLAVPIPRSQSLWYRHYALDQRLSMAELIRRILLEFTASHGGPAE